MSKQNSFSVCVRSANDLAKPHVYFSRVVRAVDGQFDINVVLSALQMLFASDSFKISIETYGA